MASAKLPSTCLAALLPSLVSHAQMCVSSNSAAPVIGNECCPHFNINYGLQLLLLVVNWVSTEALQVDWAALAQ
jgi:hypothetical protein